MSDEANTLHLSLGVNHDGDGSRPPTPSSSRSRSSRSMCKPLRHPTYYIPNGDVVFQVQETLFRVHRYFFERESPLFRDMLALPTPSDTEREGMSDENPIRLPQVVCTEFANFLWVFYNPKYSLYRASVDTWSGILKLAHRWQFAEVRELAFRELDRMPVDAVTRLALAERFEAASSYRSKAMIELAARPEPLSVEEGRELGLETSLAVAELRERMGARSRLFREPRNTRRRTRSYSRSRSRSRSPPHIVRVEPTPEPHPPPPIIVAPPPEEYVMHHPYPPSPTMYGTPGVVPVLPTVDEPHHGIPWVLPPSTYDPDSNDRGRLLKRMSKFFRSVLGRS